MRALLCALLLGSTALAGEDIDHHINQARLFIRKGWHDAAAELQAALVSPAGRTFVVYELAGRVAWELQDIDTAIAMAEGAAATAPTPAQAEAARRLADSYRQQFGFLTITAPHPGMTSRLQLESTGLILSAELKEFINAATLRLKERTALPIRVGLPAGGYLINGQEVAVVAGSGVELELPMSAIGHRGFAALQVTRLEVAAGGGMLLGEAAEALLPAPILQLSLTQPVGPVLLGALIEASPVSYTDTQNRMVSGGPAWSLGGRLGRELYLASAISVRPSLIVRRGTITGLTDALQVQGEPVDFTALGGELCVEYREAGRTTALGTGIKLSADRTWGELGDGVPYSAAGLRMLANLSVAF